MKKLAIAVAAAAALTTGVSHAYTMGTFSNGFVVPNVIHNGGTVSTAVGIIHRNAGAVHWTFFNQNSGHVTDGCFVGTANDLTPFVWSNESGVGLANTRGYLVFASVAGSGTTASTCTSTKALSAAADISGHAFEYDLTAKDVSYIPVIDGNLTLREGANPIDQLNHLDLINVAGAASFGQQMYMRYYIDGAAGGNDTRIAVWSTGNHAGSKTVNIYDDKQGVKSVNFVLTNTEQDFVDPESIVGRPSTYLDGFIVWTTNGLYEQGAQTAAGTAAIATTTNQAITATADLYNGSIFSYSVISAPAFGAVQTILNPAN